jgi:hypothetical protein
MLRHVVTSLLVATACGDDTTPGATDDGARDTTTDDVLADAGGDGAAMSDTPADVSTAACPLAEHTSASGVTSASGCELLERDATTCAASREAAGLSGFWLAFSCRVSLTPTTAGGIEVVRTEADGQPDYPSFYFAANDPCYEAYPEGHANPNRITPVTRAIDIPRVPLEGAQPMGGGIVGVALNGVPIFGDFAAPGDDIFLEVGTFDRCGAHPTEQGTYHYHGEPLAISSDDARLIGVLRDGYPVYGRRDADGSLPALDAHGGHTGPTADSPEAPVYHYHLNEQVSTAPLTAGEHQWFLTTGTYHGRPAACAACR